MNSKELLTKWVQKGFKESFGEETETVEIQTTRKGFEGDYSVVVFPWVRALKQKPESIAERLGENLLQLPAIANYNVVKGFLNVTLSDAHFLEVLATHYSKSDFGYSPKSGESQEMVEYCSPNTNKPIHLGHVRNNLLGFSLANILEAAGKPTVKTQIINDRGIHICKSMLAWQKFGAGETPESKGKKGDHLVGEYYVRFDVEYKKQIAELIAQGKTEEEAKKQAPILLEAQEMLRKWEQNDPEIRSLWEKMNSWVYDGFEATYRRMGVHFDDYQYESKTYLLGKDLVEKGLESKVFYKKADGSVWCDLTDDGLDEKLVLRADGTAVYMTQDLGTAVQRYEQFGFAGLTYVVGNEQDYHFKVLFLILEKLGFAWAKDLHHLSYGMVELPDGKLKSREGKRVDADDLMQEMQETAKKISLELGDRLEGYTQEEKETLYEEIGLGALKYFILKVDPQKRILFNPEESVQFQGDTGPFIQYTHARICSLLQNSHLENVQFTETPLSETEKELILQLQNFPEVILKAANSLNPAAVANYIYEVVKGYNSFYQNNSVLKAESEELKNIRLALSQWTKHVIANGLNILGIAAPERM